MPYFRRSYFGPSPSHPMKLLSPIPKIMNVFEETPCPVHEGNWFFTLCFDENLMDKLVFDAWGKQKMAYSLVGKVVAEEGHQKTMRPWEAFSRMLDRAVLRSDTKIRMAMIGISLHNVKFERAVQRSVRLQLMQAFH